MTEKLSHTEIWKCFHQTLTYLLIHPDECVTCPGAVLLLLLFFFLNLFTPNKEVFFVTSYIMLQLFFENYI